MKITLLPTYQNIGAYLEHLQEDGAWERYMIAPFWPRIIQWAPFSVDYLKPGPLLDRGTLLRQAQKLKGMDFEALMPKLQAIEQALPREDDDPMLIALYPSDTTMPEGVYGTGTWGNIILNINAENDNAMSWIPFVFAHEYHHAQLGFYWYCIKGGAQTKGNFLECLINEGQADSFAKSIYPSLNPSWHQSVRVEEEAAVWDKLQRVLDQCAPTEQFAPYLFGDSALGIPPYAGYYFGYKMVQGYLSRHPWTSFADLIQIPHQRIYEESGFAEKRE